MSIEFRKVTDTTSVNNNQPEAQKTPPATLWIPPASKAQVEEGLFHFLCSLSDNRPQAIAPLLVETKTLHALYTNPHPNLIAALQHCLDQFLIELGPDAASWRTLKFPTTVLGVVLAVHNCLCPLVDLSEVNDPVCPFTSSLIATLPPARTLEEMLAYHAILLHTVASLPVLSEERVALIQALFNRSPFSAISCLHLHTFPPLLASGVGLWPWWKPRPVRPTPWASLDSWLQSVVVLLQQPAIATYLRRCWLSQPDTYLACRNLGLLLEALRRRGGQRKIILEFYEAFDYFRAEQIADPWYGSIRHWPLLDHIERLLSVEGESEAAIQLNRRGNEYFLLFRPLLEIVIAEREIPPDYYHLKQDFILALRPLVDLTTEIGISRSQLQKVEFITEDKP